MVATPLLQVAASPHAPLPEAEGTSPGAAADGPSDEDVRRFTEAWSARLADHAWFQAYVNASGVPEEILAEGFHALNGRERMRLIDGLFDHFSTSDPAFRARLEAMGRAAAETHLRELKTVTYLLIFEKDEWLGSFRESGDGAIGDEALLPSSGRLEALDRRIEAIRSLPLADWDAGLPPSPEPRRPAAVTKRVDELPTAGLVPLEPMWTATEAPPTRVVGPAPGAWPAYVASARSGFAVAERAPATVPAPPAETVVPFPIPPLLAAPPVRSSFPGGAEELAEGASFSPETTARPAEASPDPLFKGESPWNRSLSPFGWMEEVPDRVAEPLRAPLPPPAAAAADPVPQGALRQVPAYVPHSLVSPFPASGHESLFGRVRGAVDAATYAVCAESRTRSLWCSPDVPLGSSVAVDVDGDGLPDATAQLAAVPVTSLSTFTLRYTLSRSVSTPLQGHVFVVFETPEGGKRIAVGFDGRADASTLSRESRLTFSMRNITASVAGNADFLLDLAHVLPGPSRLTLGVKTLDASSPLEPFRESDPMAATLEFTPLLPSLKAEGRIRYGDEQDDYQFHLRSSAPSRLDATLSLIKTETSARRDVAAVVDPLPPTTLLRFVSRPSGGAVVDYQASTTVQRFALNDTFFPNASHPGTFRRIQAEILESPARMLVELVPPSGIRYLSSHPLRGVTARVEEFEEGTLARSLSALAHDVPTEIRVDATVRSSSANVTYEADGPLGVLEARLFDATRQNVRFDVRAESLPARLGIRAEPGLLRFDADAPVGFLSVNLSRGSALTLTYPEDHATLRATPSGGLAAALSVRGLLGVLLDGRDGPNLTAEARRLGGDPFRIHYESETEEARVLFSDLPERVTLTLRPDRLAYDATGAVRNLTLRGATGGVVADAEIQDLPRQFNLSWGGTGDSGAVAYAASTPVSRLATRITSASPQREVSLGLRDVPPAFRLTWETGTGLLGFDADAPLGLLEAALSLNGGSAGTAATDHAILQGVGSAVGARLRIAGIQALSIDPTRGSFRLALSPGGQPFVASVDLDAAILASLDVSNLPPTLLVDLTAPGNLVVRAGTGISSLRAQYARPGEGVEGLIEVSGVPAIVEASWTDLGGSAGITYNASGTLERVRLFFRSASAGPVLDIVASSVPPWARISVTSATFTFDAREAAGASPGSGQAGRILVRYGSGGTLLTDLPAEDHVVIREWAGALQASLQVTGLRGVVLEPMDQGMRLVVGLAAPRLFRATADASGTRFTAAVDAIPERLELSVEGGRVRFDATAPLAGVGLELEAPNGRLLAANATAVPASMDLSLDMAGGGMGVTYSSSARLGDLDVILRAEAGGSTLHANATSLPPWMRLELSGDRFSFDARRGPAAPAGSSDVGRLLVRFASNGALLAGTPPEDHLVVRATATATQAEVLYTGLKSASLDLRNGEVHAFLQNAEPRRLRIDVASPAGALTGDVNAVPAAFSVNVTEDTFRYAASTPVRFLNLTYTNRTTQLALRLEDLPASVALSWGRRGGVLLSASAAIGKLDGSVQIEGGLARAATEDHVIVTGSGRALAIGFRVSGIEEFFAQPLNSSYFRLRLSPAGQPFLTSIDLDGTLLASLALSNVPSSVTFNLQPSLGEASYQASAGIAHLRAQFTDRRSGAQGALELRDVPSAVHATWSSARTATALAVDASSNLSSAYMFLRRGTDEGALEVNVTQLSPSLRLYVDPTGFFAVDARTGPWASAGSSRVGSVVARYGSTGLFLTDAPLDDHILLRQTSSGTYASLRYGGFRSATVDLANGEIRATLSNAEARVMKVVVDTTAVFLNGTVDAAPADLWLNLTSRRLEYAASAAIAQLRLDHDDRAGNSASLRVQDLPPRLWMNWSVTGELTASASAPVSRIGLALGLSGGTVEAPLQDHVVVRRAGPALGLSLALSGLKEIAVDPTNGGTYRLTLSPGGQSFLANVDLDGTVLASASLSNLPASVVLDLRPADARFSYRASADVTTLAARFVNRTSGAEGSLEISRVPATVQVLWPFGESTSLTYDASANVSRLAASYRRGTGLDALDMEATGIPRWMRAEALSDGRGFAFDARTDPTAARGSAEVGSILVRHGSNGTFLADPPAQDHVLLKQQRAADGSNVTWLGLRYSGLRHIAVENTTRHFDATVQASTPRLLVIGLETPDVLLTGAIDAVPAAWRMSFNAAAVDYLASAPVRNIRLQYTERLANFRLALVVADAPTALNVSWSLDRAPLFFEWSASASLAGLSVDAANRTFDAAFELTGLPPAGRLDWSTGASPRITYDASEGLARLRLFHHRADGEAVDAAVAGIPRWLEARVVSEEVVEHAPQGPTTKRVPRLVSVDARTSPWDAPGSSEIGSIALRFGSDGTFLAGTPTSDHAILENTTQGLWASLRYAGARLILLDLREPDAYMVVVESMAPRIFEIRLSTLEHLAVGRIDAVPAKLKVDVALQPYPRVRYDASAPVQALALDLLDRTTDTTAELTLKAVPASIGVDVDLRASIRPVFNWSASSVFGALVFGARNRSVEALLEVGDVPSTARLEASLGDAPTITYDASGPLGRLQASYRNITAGPALDLRGTGLSPYMHVRTNPSSGTFAFDARNGSAPTDNPGSSSVGSILARFGSDGTFLTGTTRGDNILLRAAGEKAWIDVRYAGASLLSLDPRGGELHLAFRNTGARALSLDVTTSDVRLAGALDAVPAELMVDVAGLDVAYRASAPIGSLRLDGRWNESRVDLGVSGVPAYFNLDADLEQRQILWGASSASLGFSATLGTIATVAELGGKRVWNASFAVTGVPERWDLSLRENHTYFRGVTGAVGSMVAWITNHRDLTRWVDGPHASAMHNATSGDLDVSLRFNGARLAEFEKLPEGFRVDLRLGDGDPFNLHVDVLRDANRTSLDLFLNPLPSSIQIVHEGQNTSYKATASPAVYAYSEVGNLEGLARAPAPPEHRHGLSVRDGHGCVMSVVCGPGHKARLHLTSLPNELLLDTKNKTFIFKGFRSTATYLAVDAELDDLPEKVNVSVLQGGIPVDLLDFSFGPLTMKGTKEDVVRDGKKEQIDRTDIHLPIIASRALGALTVDARQVGSYSGRVEVSNVPGSLDLTAAFAKNQWVNVTLSEGIARILVKARHLDAPDAEAHLEMRDVPSQVRLLAGEVTLTRTNAQGQEEPYTIPGFDQAATTPGLDLEIVVPSAFVKKFHNPQDRLALDDTRVMGEDLGQVVRGYSQDEKITFSSTPATRQLMLSGGASYRLNDTHESCRPTCDSVFRLETVLSWSVTPSIRGAWLSFADLSSISLGVEGLHGIVVKGEYGTFGMGYGEFGANASAYTAVNLTADLSSLPNGGVYRSNLFTWSFELQPRLDTYFHLFDPHLAPWGHHNTYVPCGISDWAVYTRHVHTDAIHGHGVTKNGFEVRKSEAANGEWRFYPEPFRLENKHLRAAAAILTGHVSLSVPDCVHGDVGYQEGGA